MKYAVQKFRKKPVVIEAIQFTGDNGMQINQWSNNASIKSPVLEPSEDNPTGEYLQIKTMEGVMIGNVGDWIIKGIKGEFYPCKPDIFSASYELDENQPEPEGAEEMLRECGVDIEFLKKEFQYNEVLKAMESYRIKELFLHEGEPAYRLTKGDEVNSILSVVMRTLSHKQMISLRDALKERIPKEDGNIGFFMVNRTESGSTVYKNGIKEDDKIDKAIVDAFNAARQPAKGKGYVNYSEKQYESAEQYLLTLKNKQHEDNKSKI